MKCRVLILFLFFSTILGEGLNAQETKAWSSLDSNAIMIGDQVHFALGITVPENMVVTWPLLVDTITSNIEIIKQSSIDTTYSENDISLKQQFTITSFDSGYFEIPQINFNFRHKDDSTYFTTSTGILFLQVFVPEVDTAQAFKPIANPLQEPYTLSEILPWVLGGLAIIAIIVLTILYIAKRKKKQPIFKRKPKPALPAHVVAIKKLEELRLSKKWQAGHLKKYYSELTDIIREYMTNRYNFDAPEMTSYEILKKLHEFNINKEAMSKMEATLNLADMVKFAKANPTPLENDLGLTHCVDFVNETKKVAEPTLPENNNETNTKDSQ